MYAQFYRNRPRNLGMLVWSHYLLESAVTDSEKPPSFTRGLKLATPGALVPALPASGRGVGELTARPGISRRQGQHLVILRSQHSFLLETVLPVKK